ncbi:TIR domain-containing protein [Sphingomonas aerolata]|uniref:TIR domain-containing protein n=1 Tax=Sphingomonas aerolata TaxID=185951 RepID=UPI002FE23332
MARRVFFSFHYARDVRRIQQVRQSWVVRPGDEAQPFYDKAEFEKVKARPGGIAKWIEDQLAGTSVTVVLFGAETSMRPWVQHEIKRSHELSKGIVAVDVHSIRDPQYGADYQGANPLDHWSVTRNGVSVPMSRVYSTYDWVRDNGYANMPTWIEAAAKAAGR